MTVMCLIMLKINKLGLNYAKMHNYLITSCVPKNDIKNCFEEVFKIS